MQVQLVTFTPPTYKSPHRANVNTDQFEGLSIGYRKVLKMTDLEIAAALKGSIELVECTAEQLTLLMIERSKHVSINRFRELNVKLSRKVEVNEPTSWVAVTCAKLQTWERS